MREWRDPSPPRARDAQSYARIRRSLELADTARGVIGTLAFAYGPLAQAIDRTTRPAAPWMRPALFAAPLVIGSALFDLPVSYVQEYTLERRFGLSEQPRPGWLGDYAKSTPLAAGVTSLIASLFGIAVRHAPRTWPALASIGAAALFVFGNLVVPVYVLPLFNAFEPLQGALEERLRRLAARFGVGDAAILRMDMSRQTRKANAFVTGVGQTHRIVIGDTLIEAFGADEIEFVVAHELGHYINRDTWRNIALGEGLAIALVLFANSSIPQAEQEKLRLHPLLLLRLYAIMLAASQVLRPLLFAFTRSREWAADRFALTATRDPSAGVSAFRRLREQNLADDDPPAWYELLFSSHPSLRARINALDLESERQV